jgi:hypothetical protein
LKKQIITLSIFLFSFSVFSQLSAEEKIKNFYGEEWYNREINENPQWVEILKLYVSNGFKVISTDHGKYSELIPINEIILTSKTNQTITIQQFLEEYERENFNPLFYQFLPTNETQVFKLEGVDKIIYIESFSYLLRTTNE